MSAQLKCIARYIQLFSLRSGTGSALPAYFASIACEELYSLHGEKYAASTKREDILI